MANAPECPECGEPMVPRDSARGKFWGCRQYPRCKGTRDSEGQSRYDRAGEPDPASDRARRASQDQGDGVRRMGAYGRRQQRMREMFDNPEQE